MKTLPTLFIGHGNPMNAIEDNAYTRRLQALGRELPRPEAILCISAHWMTKGTWVTGMSHPKTIHDFYGFPKALFDVQYPAPGNHELAEQIHTLIPEVEIDHSEWGLDHGTWAILKHLYPNADIPTLQLSLHMKAPIRTHFELGRKLRPLREQGVLILGSGNIVHNLRQIRWEENAPPFDWAIEFDEWSKEKLVSRDFEALIEDFHNTPAGKLAVPTLDHYLPLLYIAGASDEKETVRFEYEALQNGSMSMRSVSFGRS